MLCVREYGNPEALHFDSALGASRMPFFTLQLRAITTKSSVDSDHTKTTKKPRKIRNVKGKETSEARLIILQNRRRLFEEHPSIAKRDGTIDLDLLATLNGLQRHPSLSELRLALQE